MSTPEIFFRVINPLELTPYEQQYVQNNLTKKQQKLLSSRVNRVANSVDTEPLRVRVMLSNLPNSIKDEAFKRLLAPDRKYNEWIEKAITLPLSRYTVQSKCDITTYIQNCTDILNTTIHGQFHVKDKILEMLCEYKMYPDENHYSLALEGCPGIGKTTIIKEGLSKCVNRPFCFISLGGISDSSYLSGHSFTYEGALYGRLAECLIDSKVMDPIIYFDELDKVSNSAKGDEIMNTLIHLTDNVQNKHVRDKYFHGIDLDFSKCLMVFSYNNSKNINPILLDRLNIITMENPSIDEKITIAKKYMLPKYERKNTVICDETIKELVHKYKNEVGMRSIDKGLKNIMNGLSLAKSQKRKIDATDIVNNMESSELKTDTFVHSMYL